MSDELEGTGSVEGGDGFSANVGDTGDVPQSDTTQAGAQTQPEPNEFEKLIPPNELPPELKGHWKRMHGAYNKVLGDAKALNEKAAVVDRFYSDQNYARQVLAEWAFQNGYQLSPIGQQAAAQQQQAQQQQGQASNVPPALLEAVKAQLAPELQWMAPQLAASQWAAQQMLMQPLVQQSQQQQYQARSDEFDRYANELSESAPGWEEHEGRMDELLAYLQSPQMNHKEFGPKIKLLYNLVTGNASAIAEATNRMTKAVKNRTSSGVPSNKVTSNLEQRIRQSTSNNAAWELAKQAALNQHGD